MSKSIINVIDTKNKCGEINKVLKNKNDNQKHCVIYSMKGCPYCEQLDAELQKMKDNMKNVYNDLSKDELIYLGW